jgi:hypothetical protein
MTPEAGRCLVKGLGETKDEYTTERPSTGRVTPKTTRRVRSKFQQHEDEYTPGRHNHVGSERSCAADGGFCSQVEIAKRVTRLMAINATEFGA